MTCRKLIKDIHADDELKELYLIRKLSCKEIGEIYGFCESSVCRRLREIGIRMRTNSESHVGKFRLNKQGRFISNDGYIQVWLPPKHPYSGMSSNNWIAEHRLVMAQALGRCLLSTELVHHINGVKSDNRIDNLQILPRSKHRADICLSCNVELRNKIKSLEERIDTQEQLIRLLKWKIGRIEYAQLRT